MNNKKGRRKVFLPSGASLIAGIITLKLLLSLKLTHSSREFVEHTWVYITLLATTFLVYGIIRLFFYYSRNRVALALKHFSSAHAIVAIWTFISLYFLHDLLRKPHNLEINGPMYPLVVPTVMFILFFLSFLSSHYSPGTVLS